ncbi:MAG: carbohydrate kinase family protein [Solobacterium sp.]|nr:carbohydrate kinase family protein [Solobacterium sp.]
MKTRKIICAGAATYETVLSGIDRSLMDMDSVLASGSTAATGGDALNTAISLARLGSDVALCACTGNDYEADLLEKEIQKENIQACLTRCKEAATSSPVVLVDTEGERHIIRRPHSANHLFTGDMIPDGLLASACHLHIGSANVLPSLDGPPLARLFARAKRLGLTTSMDVSYDKNGRWLENIEEALAYCDIFVPSLQEASVYADTDDICRIHDFFARWPFRVFGIKLGPQGIVLWAQDSSFRCESLSAGTPVDTTGAGDACMAGILYGFINGYALKETALLGQAQAASVLSCSGANVSAGTFDQALSLIQERGYHL